MDELLIDSSYLLPIFGWKIEFREFDLIFSRKLLEKYLVRYNPVSLIEIKWYSLRQSRKSRDQSETILQNYRRGIMSLQRETRIEPTMLTNEEIEESVDLLLRLSDLRDYFDRQIYSTAIHLNCILLTEDTRLHELFESQVEDLKQPKKVLKWNDLA